VADLTFLTSAPGDNEGGAKTTKYDYSRQSRLPTPRLATAKNPNLVDLVSHLPPPLTKKSPRTFFSTRSSGLTGVAVAAVCAGSASPSQT